MSTPHPPDQARLRPVSARRRLGPGRPIPLLTALGPLLLLALWSLSSLDERMLPPPWRVVEAGIELLAQGRLHQDLIASGQRAGIGFAIGLCAGVVLALIAGLSRWGEALIDGPVQINRAVPSLAMIPLLILWLGIGESMKIAVIALSVVVPIYMHTHNGLRSIDSRYVELAETTRLSHGGFIRHVVLPGSLPGFMLGLRFAVLNSWVGLVVVEQINATSGIGYMMTLARSYGQTEIVIVGLVIYALFGLLADALVRTLEKRILAWRRTLSD